MRGASIAALLMFCIWIVLTVKMNCAPDFNRRVCESLCNSNGRELDRTDQGFITRCICGKRKKAPKSLRRGQIHSSRETNG